MRRGVALACLAGAALVWIGGAGSARGLHGNNFFVNCRFSHTANDDPIVHPGTAGQVAPAHVLREPLDGRELDAGQLARSGNHV